MLKKLLVGLITLMASVGMAIAAVNINTATQEELESLPNIGPVKAKAIIDYRKANGNFKTVDDIKSVKGIGDISFDKLKSQISVSGATVVEAASAAKADKKEAKTEKKEPKADKKAAKAEGSAPAAEQSAAKAEKKSKKKDKKD
ncbi:helix-hairpin-helix domain-containing protein [Uliginosibacterium sp. 31-16]|uniref:ComEA family DNA-binding protein n=1 Tax=Uliginosibacterium sp. 31-16 TaxID=3068315 RepID=UPI002740140D|nr:helix-hairpin-helix domain-containing protein [Uliginosibacterium sp. 31-16]MDP5239989.1 helix-hairpin-helix domain-containing protein [Uliginosibacterium sp. 31-16]